MSTLEHAIAIAAQAHEGQTDHGGERYILHPLRVMGAVQPTDRIVAVLHDVVEDNGAWTFERLAQEGFGEALAALEHLCRRTHEPYLDYVRRAAGHPVALRVKLQDVRDNFDDARLARCPLKIRSRLAAKYSAALPILTGALP